jgi:hypothetical protein
MTSILSGRLEDQSGWDLDKDAQDRIVRGRRETLRFEVRQFFGASHLPRLLGLSSSGDRGSLKILRLNFNQRLKKDAFRPSFLEDKNYSAATWAEIDKWLRHED